MPLSYQSTADLMPAVKTITALEPYTDNILILVNNTAPEHIKDLTAVLMSRFPNLPIQVVSHSRYISRLADDGLTVFELAELWGIERYQLRRILPQIRTLYDYLDKQSRA